MKINQIIIIALLSLAPQFTFSQATVPLNSGISSDYLGWSAGVNQDLNFKVYNNNRIQLRIASSFGRGVIRRGGYTAGVTVSGQAPATILVSINGTFLGPIGLQARTDLATPIGVQGATLYGGIFAVRSNGVNNIGIRGRANGFTSATSENYGVYGRACTDIGDGFAIYGTASLNQFPNLWAGWFEGDVWHTGAWPLPCDETLKQNIVDFSGSLDILNQLNPVQYVFKPESIEKHGYSAGVHYGFISQEVAQVLPNLTKLGRNLPKYDDDDEMIYESSEILMLDYLRIIPILIDAMQERQAIIDQQNANIAALALAIAELEAQLE